MDPCARSFGVTTTSSEDGGGVGGLSGVATRSLPSPLPPMRPPPAQCSCVSSSTIFPMSSTDMSPTSAATSAILSRRRSRNCSMRSPSMKLRCSSARPEPVRRSFSKERHSAWLSPPTPFTTLRSAVCRRLSFWNMGSGREATTPMTPLMVPKSRVGMLPASLSGSRMTREPRLKRLTASPRCISPATSSRMRSSSVAASLFLRTVNML
mmetsp:Transcript_7532/g.19325  ORF Transcript_7532/g.19325 Transcript_7532/m.19325 type:complete len:209 (-) Transcript_7532:1119-1745(-)